MSEAVPGGWHWRASCFINGCAGGSFSEPACSRAWRTGCRWFIEAMAIAWRDPVHCEDVHRRWSQAANIDRTLPGTDTDRAFS